MIDFYQIYEDFAQTMGESQARTLVRTLRQIYEELHQTVTKSEFNELKAVVHELAAAQKRTEQRLEELAEAQKRTEERLESLTLKVEELAAAQKRTEQRLEELAEAQKRTEQRVEELAEAQKRTEESLRRTNERLEGVSNSVGYTLENAAYKALPSLLAARGVTVRGPLVRRYLEGTQVNVYGEGERDGEPITIIGECKVRPSRTEVDRFLKAVERLERAGVIRNPFRIFVAHDYHPSVEDYLAQKAVTAFWSYEF